MEFKVVDLIKYYFKNITISLLVIIISLSIGLHYIFNIYETKYEAKTTIMLGANEQKTDLGFNKSVIKNYLELINSTNVLEKTIESTKVKYTVKQLREMTDAYYEDDTQLITIKVKSTNKNDAPKLSYALYQELEKEVERIFRINNIHLIDTDTKGYEKYSTNILVLITVSLSVIISILINVVMFLINSELCFDKKIWYFIKEKTGKKKNKKSKKNNKKSKKKKN